MSCAAGILRHVFTIEQKGVRFLCPVRLLIATSLFHVSRVAPNFLFPDPDILCSNRINLNARLPVRVGAVDVPRTNYRVVYYDLTSKTLEEQRLRSRVHGDYFQSGVVPLEMYARLLNPPKSMNRFNCFRLFLYCRLTESVNRFNFNCLSFPVLQDTSLNSCGRTRNPWA